jgi:Leucine-rich repeat (LRR) protein
MSFEQLESVWPLHGSVLIQNDVLYCVAGRSMFLDGGLRLWRLEPISGQVLSETVLDETETATGKRLHEFVSWLNMPTALPDVLSSDGRFVYMRSQPFDLEGRRLPLKPMPSGRDADQGAPEAIQGTEHAHLFSPTGFLDDSWWHRTYWLYGTMYVSGWQGYYRAGKTAPAGRLLVSDDSTVYGFGRKPKYWRWTTPIEHHLFAAPRNQPAPGDEAKAGGPRRVPGFKVTYHWTSDLPLHARAIVLANETLFVAGPEDLIDEEQMTRVATAPEQQSKLKDQVAAWSGKKGGLLLAVKAANGDKQAEMQLDVPPVFDGMAAARGCLFVCGMDGSVVCLGAKPSEAGETKASGAPKPEPAKTDDPSAVEALSKTASELKRDDDGFVIEVSFRGTTIGDDALKPLLGLRRVRSVLLNETPITDNGLATIGRLLTLTNVDLRGCKVSNAGIAHLAGLSRLRGLKLTGKDGAATVDDDGLDAIAKLTSLKALALDHLWVSEEGLAKLKGLERLEELYLAQTVVGDEALALFTQFPRLRKLRISQTQITSKGLSHLSKLDQLEDLDLSENGQLDDEGMAPLAGLKQLKRLNLWRVPITDAGVAHLKGLTNLQWLNLDNTQLSDAGLEYLREMKQLTFLHLGSTAVTDAGLEDLESLTALKDLKITRTAVTVDGVTKLKKKLPDTEIQLKYIEGQ